MKRAEVRLPDSIYQEVEGLAAQLHLTVPEFLRQAAEQMLPRQPKRPPLLGQIYGDTRPNG